MMLISPSCAASGNQGHRTVHRLLGPFCNQDREYPKKFFHDLWTRLKAEIFDTLPRVQEEEEEEEEEDQAIEQLMQVK
jgi:hypothetical protein